MQLPLFHWKQNGQWQSDMLDIDIWMADDVPKSAFKLSLKQGDQEDTTDPRFSYVRKGEQVIVSIKAKKEIDERFFVMCNSSSQTVRSYSDGREMKVTFQIPSSETAEIIIVKESELQVWASNGGIMHFTVEELRFAE